nr:hypothetical protein [Tanacetum cinerariifolium]
MITYLTKSDTSEGFVQIHNFLNASVIQYTLTINPTIYVSSIKQFWSSVSIKKTNDVVRLQALINRRKVIITEDTVRQALHLNDADSIDCLPNEEIFAELARMGLVRNVDSSSKFYMYPRFLQLMISAQVGNLSSHTTTYTSPTLIQKVFANRRRFGKGFSRVDTPLFKGMLVPQQVADDVAADDIADAATDDVTDEVADVVAEPTPPSPTPAITPPPSQELPSTSHDKIAQALEITNLKKRVKRLEKKNKLKVSGLRRLKKMRMSSWRKLMLKRMLKLLKRMSLFRGDKKITVAAAPITAATITAAPSATRKRKGVVIRDPEETATPSTIVHSEPKSKDKGKGILVEEPKPLKKQAQIEQDEVYARELEAELNKNINWDDVIEQVKRKEKEDNAILRYQALKKKPQTEAQARKNIMVYLKNMAGFKMDFFKGISYDDIRPIFEKHFNSVVGFLERCENELEEEASRALKRKTESSEQQAVKKQKEDLEMLWKIVQERFASSKPKNFSDDFLLNTLKAMFEKPDVEASIWKIQRGSYGLAKVKSWKLLESLGVHIITFITTQMILLVERIYPLTRFTLDQMLNDVRLEVEEESKVSLKLLRFVRRQHFGVDAVEDFKEYTLRDYYCWLKTYCCWYKLKLLDNVADSRLRLLEQSAANDKMKK